MMATDATPATVRRRGNTMPSSAAASVERRSRQDDASWVEISSQPSSSSLSSAADEVITTGLRVQNERASRKRRPLRQNAPSGLQLSRRPSSAGDVSSQEEYEESESESDRILDMSDEPGPTLPLYRLDRAHSLQERPSTSTTAMARQSCSAGLTERQPHQSEDETDEDRTAVNYPIRNTDLSFTPQPNAFSHPPAARSSGAPANDSYFPAHRCARRPALATHHSLPARRPDLRRAHTPQNILSPSYNAAAQHDEALRTSLSTLLSCAAAARGLSKPDSKRLSAPAGTNVVSRGSNRIEPSSIRLIPASALPTTSPPDAAAAPTSNKPSPPIGFDEPTFRPTLRRDSTSTTSSSNDAPSSSQPRSPSSKRKTTRNSSRERRNLKKARRLSGFAADDYIITPTLLTWLVSAGVVVALSALSFTAGYSLGREAGKMEGSLGDGGDFASLFAGDEPLHDCAREAGRQSLGLKRSLAKSAVQV